MNWWFHNVVLILVCGYAHSADEPPRVVCYLRGSSFRNGFSLTNVASVPCTHVIYSYARLNSDENRTYVDPSDEDSLNSLVRWRERMQPSLKILMEIGTDDDRDQYSVVTSELRRGQMIDSIITLCLDYGLNGVNLHWTYPGKFREEKMQYVFFSRQLRSEFDMIDDELVVSMTIPNAKDLIIPGFNLLWLSAEVDFFNLPAFNFTPDASPSDYHQAPIRLSTNSKLTDNSLSSITKLYLRIGAIASRLVLGVPLFGRRVNTDTNQVINYELPINEICRMVAEGGWNSEGDATTGPLLRNGNQVISFDDASSVSEKAKIVNKMRLGGVMFWSMDMDDWNSSCPTQDIYNGGNGGRWPLIDAAMKIVIGPEAGSSGSSGAMPGVVTTTQRVPNNIPGTSNRINVIPDASPVNRFVPPTVQPQREEQTFNGPQSFSPEQVVPPPLERPLFNSRPDFPLTQDVLSTFRIVEAGKDIVIEDFQIQFNENNFRAQSSTRIS